MAWFLGPAVTGLGALITYGIASGIGQGLVKFAAAMGVGFVTYQGMDLLVSQNEGQVLSLLSSMPPLAVALIGVLKIGTVVKIIFSAMLMRATLFGMNSGVVKRMQVTGPAS